MTPAELGDAVERSDKELQALTAEKGPDDPVVIAMREVHQKLCEARTQALQAISFQNFMTRFF